MTLQHNEFVHIKYDYSNSFHDFHFLYQNISFFQ